MTDAVRDSTVEVECEILADRVTVEDVVAVVNDVEKLGESIAVIDGSLLRLGVGACVWVTLAETVEV